MTVASINEAEIQPLFELLIKRVEEAMQSCTGFKSLIGNFKSTLDPLQPWITGERKGLEDLVINKERLDLDEKIRRGIEIVGKFTNVAIWKYYCGRCGYTEQLVQLDRYFNKLLDSLMTKETCVWGKLVAEMDRRQSVLAEKLSQLGGDEFSEMLEKQEGLSEALLLLRNTETLLTVHDQKEEEGREELCASLESTTLSLVSSIELIKEQCATMFQPLLEDLISTLHDFSSNDFKWHSEGLKSLTVEMNNGEEMVLECCKVGKWACYNTKYKYVNALLGLNRSLRRMREVEFERVREDMVEMSNIEPLMDRVERAMSLAVKIQTQTRKGSSRTVIEEM